MDPVQDIGAVLLNGTAIPSTPNYINPAYATPNQRAQLYAYANELMKPQPVHNWAQGLGEIARALIGGYEGHQADVQEQAAQAQNKADFARVLGAIESPASQGNGAPPAPESQGGPASATSGDSPSAPMTPEVQKALFHASVDSGVPLPILNAMAGQESSYNPNAPHGGLMQITDATARDPGYGMSGVDPATLSDPTANAEFGAHYLAARSPGTDWNDPQQRAAALTAYNGGGDPNYATHVMARMPGIAASQPQEAMPVPASNRLPVSAAAIGELMGNANISDAEKHLVQEQLAPRLMKDALGNVTPMYQNQPVGPTPAFRGGVNVPFDPLHPTIPGFLGGTAAEPSYKIIPPGAGPQAAGLPQGGTTAQPNGSGIAGFMAPGTPVGDLAKAGQTLQAQGGVLADQAKANQARFQATQQAGPALIEASYPLRQIQSLLEKNNGMLPTGEGAAKLVNAASLGNMIATVLGHPLTDEDSKLTAMQLLHKYGTLVATTQAKNLNVSPTNLGLQTAEQTSPGTELSGPANLHLVDNLIRLNQLAQKKTQFEHDYYLSHGQGPDAYNNFTKDWIKQISGPNAIPLSKYGRHVTLKNGQAALYVPSTDPSGYSLFPANSPELQ